MRLSQAELDMPLGQPLVITEVERRILRACKTLRAVPDHEAKFMKIYSPWPEIKRAVEDAYGYTEATMPKFRPSPADVSDMLRALGWAKAVEKYDFKLIWWRSFNMSFRQIGARLRVSESAAKNWYKDTLLKVWHEANSQLSRG